MRPRSLKQSIEDTDLNIDVIYGRCMRGLHHKLREVRRKCSSPSMIFVKAEVILPQEEAE